MNCRPSKRVVSAAMNARLARMLTAPTWMKSRRKRSIWPAIHGGIRGAGASGCSTPSSLIGRSAAARAETADEGLELGAGREERLSRRSDQREVVHAPVLLQHHQQQLARHAVELRHHVRVHRLAPVELHQLARLALTLGE